MNPIVPRDTPIFILLQVIGQVQHQVLLPRLEGGLAQVRAAGASEGVALGAVAARAGRHLLGLVLVRGSSSSSTGSSFHGLQLRPTAAAVVARLASSAVVGRGRTGGSVDGGGWGQYAAGSLLGQQIVLVDHIVVVISIVQVDFYSRRAATTEIELDGGRLVRRRFQVGGLLLPRREDAARAVPAFRFGAKSRQDEGIVHGH
mmetsp:Transcript_14796/g.24626  ORF Transcript_14796/g.24626 Transcript_14796/m.24626 type:complete len:202 (+) Transcript_14796:155-760(+)